jgi:hypothetical protein
LCNHLAVDSFGVRPFLFFERDPREAHFELRLELVLRQIAFNAMAFGAVRIQDQYRGGPGRIEAMEPRGVFPDVSFDGEKIRADGGGDALIGVRLGFQPSAGPSSRSRAEIEQYRPAGLLRLAQSGIDIPAPLNCHW